MALAASGTAAGGTADTTSTVTIEEVIEPEPQDEADASTLSEWDLVD